ncbi:hypothetical protein COCNU_scaffold002139G000030 [Cocos nucifera]|nr:hypothetical protein [Cocos nucifera]
MSIWYQTLTVFDPRLLLDFTVLSSFCHVPALSSPLHFFQKKISAMSHPPPLFSIFIAALKLSTIVDCLQSRLHPRPPLLPCSSPTMPYSPSINRASSPVKRTRRTQEPQSTHAARSQLPPAAN